MSLLITISKKSVGKSIEVLTQDKEVSVLLGANIADQDAQNMISEGTLS